MGSAERRYRSRSTAQTVALGVRLGQVAGPGLVLELIGDLGAGKTHFVRGLATGLGVPSGVRSPTFTICQVHEGRCPLFHIDAYRIDDPEELLIQGYDEMRDVGVVAVEWADRIEPLLPPRRLRVEIDCVGEEERDIRMFAWGEDFERLLDSLPPGPDVLG